MAPSKTIPPFPAAAVHAALKAELIVSVKAEGQRKGQSLPDDPAALVSMTFEIDSLLVVEILCVLDGILPFKVGENVVRAGGYSSINAALGHVVGRIEREWNKYHGGK